MMASAIFILLAAILTGAWFIVMDALRTLAIPDRYPDALYRWEGVVCAVVIGSVLMRHLLGARYQHPQNHDQKLTLDDKLLIAGFCLPFAIVLSLIMWGSASKTILSFAQTPSCAMRYSARAQSSIPIVRSEM